MVNIKNIFTRTYYFIERVPVLNSATNLIDLCQKCIVLPFMDKNKIASSHYYSRIERKNLSKCFLLSLPLPVILTAIVGVRVLIEKIKADIRHKIDGDPVSIDNISMDDIKNVYVDVRCKDSFLCQHESYIDLKNGERAYLLDSYQICSIVHAVSEDIIIMNGIGRDPGKLKQHFVEYNRPGIRCELQTPQQVLDTLNNERKFRMPQKLSWWENLFLKHFGCDSPVSSKIEVLRPKDTSVSAPPS